MIRANAIVVIDDDDDDRFLLAQAFRITGVKQKIVELSCANEFIALLDKWHAAPNLILLDIDMPAMNGLELMDALRKYAQLNDTPKIMLSTGSLYRERARQAGADDFHLKPVTLDQYLDLARTIRHKYLA